jgi:GDP-L-fucose synthase
MRIVVIGGHGFVGKAFMAAAQRPGDTLVPLSRRDGLDMQDLATVRRCLGETQPDLIVNCAAHVGSVHYVTAYAADVFGDNAQMTLNLYRGVKEVCPNARIINPLSNCSYPGGADIHYEPDWWQGEVHDSVYSYGNSRRFIYVTAACYRKQYGVRSINFLVPNTYGPGDTTDPNKTHALNGMVIRMLQAQRAGKSEFEIWGTGSPIREWGYIDDIASILARGITFEGDLTYPVNIAQNHGYSIRESAELIAREINFEGRLYFNTQYQDGAPRKVLDDRRFRGLFPDFQFTCHVEGIRRTVAYYRACL